MFVAVDYYKKKKLFLGGFVYLVLLTLAAIRIKYSNTESLVYEMMQNLRDTAFLPTVKVCSSFAC